MSRFHHPRRGWLPHLLDGLKLTVLGIFFIGYMALAIKPDTHSQIDLGIEQESTKEDSVGLSRAPANVEKYLVP